MGISAISEGNFYTMNAIAQNNRNNVQPETAGTLAFSETAGSMANAGGLNVVC